MNSFNRFVCIIGIPCIMAAPQLARASTRNVAQVLRYCVPVSQVNYYPFRIIRNGNELGYLLLLRSYISTQKSDPGILDRYEFSPDGRTFLGHVAADATWPDGSEVTPYEAAMGIAKGITYRTIGDRVRVVGTENIDKPGWQNRKYSGIKIIDKRTFQLTFSSQIKNLTGAMREALSTDSRQDRMWPIKLTKRINLRQPIVIAKFPLSWQQSTPTLRAYGVNIAVVGLKRCAGAEFAVSTLDAVKGRVSEYSESYSHFPIEISVQPNTQRLNLSQRTRLIDWLRYAFRSDRFHLHVVSTPSFFLVGEPGYNANVQWPSKISESDLNNLRKKSWTLAYEAPWYKTIISKIAKRDGLQIRLISFPFKTIPVDAQIMVSDIQNGRQIIFQDFLKWPHVSDFIKNARETRSQLKVIAKKSAETIPPDTKTLQAFEQASIKEQSFAPIGRHRTVIYSKLSAPVHLVWESQGEFTFRRR